MDHIIFAIPLLLGIDFYAYQPVKILSGKKTPAFKKWAKWIYWSIPVIILLGFFIYGFIDDFLIGRNVRYAILLLFTFNYLPKVFIVIFLLIHDSIGILRWVIRKFSAKRDQKKLEGKPISRSEFISKAALISAGAPLAMMGFGIVRGAHDYQLRRKQVFLKNLPQAFDGIKIGHISDIHTGSFFSKTAVQGGIDILMNEKPDVVFFTGDLVNNVTSEVKDYINIFDKVRAPLGVFSSTGNHDYGDYAQWFSEKAKVKNFEDLKEAHKLMGYDLLLNENRHISLGGDKLGIIGVENWGAGRFSKHGDLDAAMQNTDDYAVKLLLSHDPSHWDAQVLGKTDIDLMFAGHTHGFQMGVEVGDFKWSPSQYLYKQWADLYQEGEQYLYVNRGYGYIGYPGRIGIMPEVTMIELKKG
ncbi:MAG: metallophosphoesterase [Cyclobacteriaceae bacterium]|nr:metallophosphoesterase [Cyclobacteriaceae bacterium]